MQKYVVAGPTLPESKDAATGPPHFWVHINNSQYNHNKGNFSYV